MLKLPAPAEPAAGEPAALPLLLPADDPPALCANEAAGDSKIMIAAMATVAEGLFIGSLPYGATFLWSNFMEQRQRPSVVPARV